MDLSPLPAVIVTMIRDLTIDSHIYCQLVVPYRNPEYMKYGTKLLPCDNPRFLFLMGRPYDEIISALSSQLASDDAFFLPQDFDIDLLENNRIAALDINYH